MSCFSSTGILSGDETERVLRGFVDNGPGCESLNFVMNSDANRWLMCGLVLTTDVWQLYKQDGDT